MKEKTRTKDNNRLRFKDYFGTTFLATADSMGSCLMTSMFMLYLTDYAGIGKWGAILGTALLFAARIFDAVNDPLEGWIMDRAQVGKHGKYRPFLLISVLAIMAGVIGLFFLPGGLANSPVLICVWVIFFYLLYDIGASFYAPNLLYRTMTLDSGERGKLLIGPRVNNMVIGMVGGSMLAIINAVNNNFNNMHTSFGVTVTVFALIAGVLSVGGLALVREKHHSVADEEEQVKITDIFKLLKENKALRIRVLDQLLSGFIWTFLFAAAQYYIKWTYCADLTTGVVDSDKLGGLVLLSSMMMFLPLVIGTFIASPIMNKIGSPIKFHRILILMQGGSCLLLFVLHIIGLLQLTPVLFFLCVGICATAIGADYIPGETINIEAMDYEIYQNGRDRSALCNACNKFLNKAQSAISSGMVGIILVAIGYEVDSVTDTFLGELSAIPSMLVWFVVIMGLVPGVLGLVSWAILKKYPVNDEVRAKMRQSLSDSEQ